MSTKWPTTTSQPDSLNTKETSIFDDWNPSPGTKMVIIKGSIPIKIGSWHNTGCNHNQNISAQVKLRSLHGTDSVLKTRGSHR